MINYLMEQVKDIFKHDHVIIDKQLYWISKIDENI